MYRIVLLVDRLRMRYGRPLVATVKPYPAVHPSTLAAMRDYVNRFCVVSAPHNVHMPGRLCAHKVRLQAPMCFMLDTEDVYIWYAFPTVKDLAMAEEAELWDLGFGYHAKSICAAAKTIATFATGLPPFSPESEPDMLGLPSSNRKCVAQHFCGYRGRHSCRANKQSENYRLRSTNAYG